MDIVDFLPVHPDDELMDSNPVLFWNRCGLEFNRLTHSIGGPQGGPTMSSRALGILQLAVHDAFFAINPPSHAHWTTYLHSTTGAGTPQELPPRDPIAGDVVQAIAGAAIRSLQRLYRTEDHPDATKRQLLKKLLDKFVNGSAVPVDTASPSYQFGHAVAERIIELLAVKAGEPGAEPVNPDGTPYEPKSGRGKFRPDPSNPTDKAHGPSYGLTTRRFSVQRDHKLADPPLDDALGEYENAVREVIALGGAPNYVTTVRTPDQSVAAHFWAYDGANLLGTPPRLYNRIIRRIAWERKRGNAIDTADFARVLALANVAMGDAGVFAWLEKFHFEFWRPLPGVREHDTSTGPEGIAEGAVNPPADPFFETLSAPHTNSNDIPFKPPFPAYPSGHATFGAAAFQMVRRFYEWRGDVNFGKREPDRMAFSFTSEEMDGRSRDLYQPYSPTTKLEDQRGLVRTRVNRHFDSLWSAILENGASRVYLGVHWRFDAFAANDVVKSQNPNGSTVYKDHRTIRFVTEGNRNGEAKTFPIGGVPLGLDIADDIFESGMKQTPGSLQPGPLTGPAAASLAGAASLNIADTNIR